MDEELRGIERGLERANEQISEIADLLYGQADGLSPEDRLPLDQRLSQIDARLKEYGARAKMMSYLAMIACIALVAHVVRHW